MRGVDRLKTGVAGIIEGIEIKITDHYLIRKIGREIRTSDIYDALRNPKIIKDPVVDQFGRSSQRYIGSKAEVVINPNTGNIISVNPVRANTRKKIGEM